MVKFADGTATYAELVIGADGIHSVVRAHYVVWSSFDLMPITNFGDSSGE